MPLYDILNEFQKGLSHIALVLRHRSKIVELPTNVREVKLNIYGESHPLNTCLRRSRRSLRKSKGLSGRANVLRRDTSKSRRWSQNFDSEILHIVEDPLPSFTEEEEVVGFITIEDVIEQLLKDEIYDEMHHHGEYFSFSGSGTKIH